MGDENKLEYPYYDLAYLDDNNTMHLAKVAKEEAVDYLKDRFSVVSCNFIQRA